MAAEFEFGLGDCCGCEGDCGECIAGLPDTMYFWSRSTGGGGGAGGSAECRILTRTTPLLGDYAWGACYTILGIFTVYRLVEFRFSAEFGRYIPWVCTYNNCERAGGVSCGNGTQFQCRDCSLYFATFVDPDGRVNFFTQYPSPASDCT